MSVEPLGIKMVASRRQLWLRWPIRFYQAYYRHVMNRHIRVGDDITSPAFTESRELGVFFRQATRMRRLCYEFRRLFLPVATASRGRCRSSGARPRHRAVSES